METEATYNDAGLAVESAERTGASSRMMKWGGWVLTILPAALLLFSGAMKVTQSAEVMEGFTHLGYPSGVALWIGIVELACAILYLVPKTAILGAILVTGYLGGATATHVRVSEPFIMPVIFGVIVWLGIYLRESRLRQLIPLRTRNKY